MSTIKAEITTLSNIRPHTNPEVERLELADCLGWQVVVPKGKYQEGTRCIYIEPGTVVPEALAESYGVTQYLSRKISDGVPSLVVHGVRLKGAPSFGLVVDVPPALHDLEIGSDASTFLGLTKYNPPVRVQITDAEPEDPWFPRYTNIENMRSYPDIILPGTPVVITEKIHGTNARIGFVRDSVTGYPCVKAGSRQHIRKSVGTYSPESYGNPYWHMWNHKPVQELIASLYAEHHSAVLFGETFGTGIQKYTYGRRDKLEFLAFDLMIDGQYVDWPVFEAITAEFGVGRAPTLYEGHFDIEVVKRLSNGRSVVGGEHGREGVVVRPRYELFDRRIGRVVLKYVGDDYLFAKQGGQNETTDA